MNFLGKSKSGAVLEKEEVKSDDVLNCCMYSLYDKVANYYHAPVIGRNDAEIKRSLQDSMYSGKAIFCTHPEDFELCRIGTYDERTGNINAVKPILVCALKDVKTPVDSNS